MSLTQRLNREISKTNRTQVNVVGPVVLFGAVYELLKKSKNPRFIPISSPGGSLSGPVIEFPMGSVMYASTKATLNWVARKIHFENDWLSESRVLSSRVYFYNYFSMRTVSFPLSPGEIDTDMCTHLHTVYPLNLANGNLFRAVDFTILADKSGEYQDLIKKRGYGLPPAPEVAALLLKIIDNSTREENGGEFMSVDGGKLPW